MKASETDNSGRTTCGLITLGNNPGRNPSPVMQFDLFKGGPNVVAVFPLHRRADMVRKVAAALDCRDYKAGQRYWSTHVHQERAKLARQGMSRAAIDVEITRYAHAISRALRLQEQFGKPDDAA